MTDKSLNNSNIPNFYNDCYKLYFWTKHQAIALSLSLDPNNGIPKPFHMEYTNRMKLLEQAIECDKTLKCNGQWIEGWGSLEGYTEWPDVIPLSFIDWGKKKDISFPIELEVLVREYHKDDIEETDWKSQCEENNKKIKELEEVISKLNIKVDELENDKPNTKSFNSYKQLALGALALLYPEQVKIWIRWSNEGATTIKTTETELKFTEIQNALASLNAQGINIKRDAISDKIKESVYLLKSKP